MLAWLQGLPTMVTRNTMVTRHIIITTVRHAKSWFFRCESNNKKKKPFYVIKQYHGRNLDSSIKNIWGVLSTFIKKSWVGSDCPGGGGRESQELRTRLWPISLFCLRDKWGRLIVYEILLTRRPCRKRICFFFFYAASIPLKPERKHCDCLLFMLCV